MNRDLIKETTFNIRNFQENKLIEIVTEGLKRKGYSFDNKEDLKNFIKLNCNKFVNGNTCIYTVNEKPFLCINWCNEFVIDKTEINKISVSCDLFKYGYYE